MPVHHRAGAVMAALLSLSASSQAIITVLLRLHADSKASQAATRDIEDAITAHIMDLSLKQRLLRARPHQGGQRITSDWLLDLDDRECLWTFRFTASEIFHLCDALTIPMIIKTKSGYKFPRVEALCLLLARMRDSGDAYRMTMLYNRCQSSISEIFNELVIYVDRTWSPLLTFNTNGVLAPECLAEYAEAVHEYGAPLTGIWGFIDCTIRHICRPSHFQRAAYNGYKKYHALKYQAVLLPNGIIGHLYGPVEGRRNDNALLADSGLLDWCREHAIRPDVPPDAPPAQRFLQIYGDPAYGVSFQIMSGYHGLGERTEEELEFNYAMSRARMAVEDIFGLILANWPFLNAFWKMKVESSPVGRYYRIGVLLTNAMNCLRPNTVATRFDVLPPSLEDYFNV